MRPLILLPLLALAGCGSGASSARAERPKLPITVFAAASLARPLQALADSFALQSRVAARSELGGSMEQSRKLTELGRTPDVLILVDDEVMAALVPAHLDWYVRFATNRLVVAYGPKSRHRDSITTDNWWRMLQRRDVRVGRADPDVAPAGKHAVTLIERAEAYYRQPGLSRRLLAQAAQENIRPNATELAALLETGEVDYILDYESVARQYGFEFVALPPDLAETVLYCISVPRLAANFQSGVAFVSFVLSETGRRILRASTVTLLDVPVAVGSVVPPEITHRARSVALVH